MKKILSFLLSIAMLASVLPATVFAAESKKFTDVNDSDYYAQATAALAALEILSGYDDGSFGPERTITRAEMAVVVCKMLGLEPAGASDFEDTASHWSNGYVGAASAKGIIAGDGNGKFRPEDNVKYEEAIKMVVCSLGMADDVTPNPDDWSAGYLAVAAEKKITNSLKGSKGVASTRGDVAIMVYNGLTADLAAPTASKQSGSYQGTQRIELSSDVKGAVIYYTTDGTTPTVNSAKYTGAVSITKDTTLKAVAVKDGVLIGDVLNAEYKITTSPLISGGKHHGSSSDEYTVSFDLNYEGATGAPASHSVKKGDYAIMPDDPIRDGFIFMGWHLNDTTPEIFDFESTVITKNQTIYAQWVDITDTTDTDSDGLTNPFERYFGTDETKADTDGDELNDYFELYVVNTDPLKADTDNNGITDNLEDADDDKLNNEEEYNRGTNAIYYDTDHDMISDYDEIYVYGTDPLNDDTDGDGVKDGDEIAIGSNPLVAETSFTTQADFGEPTENNPVSIKVNAITDSEGAGSLEIEAVMRSDNYLISDTIAGYLGYAYDLTTNGELLSAELTFTYDESLGTIGDDFQPRIYYLNENTGEFEELPNQTVNNGQVLATTTHFSTYILLNKVEFDKVWDTEIEPPLSNDDGSEATLDIAFIIDYSASMDDNDRKMIFKSLCKEFISKLRNGKDSATVIKFIRRATLVTELTSNKDTLNNAIDSISYDDGYGSYSGTDGSTGYKMALDELSKSTSQFKYIIFITDGEDNGYTYSYDDLIEQSIVANTVVYTIGMGSASESILKNIAQKTNGKYYHATTGTTTDDMRDLTDVFDDIQGETVDKTTDSNNDGISDYYTKLINDGELCLTNGSYELAGCTDIFGKESSDWDGDGLLNGEEIEIVIGSNGKPKIKMKSHPFWADYDCDGYNDYVEFKKLHTDPLKYSFPSKMSYDNLTNSSLYYAWCISENYDNNWFVKYVTNISDWHKTEESEKILIDYFYDYASEESVNASANAIEKQAKAETVISGVNNILKITKNLKGITDATTGISELDRKQEKVANFKANVFKGLPKIFECANKRDTETALTLLSSTMGDIKTGASLVEDFNNTVEGILDTTETITGDISSALKIGKDVFNLMYKDGRMVNLPVPKAFTKFSQKYTKWMKSDAFAGLEKAQVVSIAFDIVDLAADSADLYSTYSKMSANTEAYIEYIEAIDYISENGNNIDFVQNAAGEVLQIVLKDGDFMQEWVKAVYADSVQTFISIGSDLLAKNPYVAAVKAAIDLGIYLSGITKTASATIKILMADSISDSFVYMLNSCVQIDNDIWFSVNSYDTAIKYLTQLAQSRIYGEDIAKGEYNISSLSHWLADIVRSWKGDMTSDEMLADINRNISIIYKNADIIGLVLSAKLPKAESASDSGSGGA